MVTVKIYVTGYMYMTDVYKRQPLHFYRTIGIGVKDKKALSNSTRLFVDYVRTWVAENGNRCV